MRQRVQLQRRVVELLLISLVMSGAAESAELRKETLEAFNKYVTGAQTAATLHHAPSRSLWVDTAPERLREVRDGEIVAAPVGGTPYKAPNGLIHDWVGAEFIPNATIDEVFAVVRDYRRYREFYGPLVIDSKLLGNTGDQYRFEMLMMNHALFSRSALDGEYSESYIRMDDRNWYSIGASRSIRQIDHYGETDERRLAPGEGSGYIWRIFSIQRFEQRDGGVYVELEVIVLSRGIPASLHFLVDPIVRHVAKSSITTSLENTRNAVNSGTAAVRGTPVGGKVAAGYR